MTNDACSFVRRPSYWSSTVVESHCAAQTTSSVSHVQPCRRRVRSLLCRQSGEIRQATSITPPAVIEMRYIAPFNNFPSANVKEIVDPLAVGRHYFFDGGWWKVIGHWLSLAVVPSKYCARSTDKIPTTKPPKPGQNSNAVFQRISQAER